MFTVFIVRFAVGFIVKEGSVRVMNVVLIIVTGFGSRVRDVFAVGVGSGDG
jgi:hypothetical protein